MKKSLIQIVLTAILFIISFFIKYEILNLYILLIAYFIIGYKILFKAIKNIIQGIVFDENFLMTIASIGAFLIGKYLEGVAIILFYQIGELFEDYSVSKSKKSIKEAMNLHPEYANIKKDEKIIKVNPSSINIGDIIIIKPGEKIPLDGVITKGSSSIDTSNLTGESALRDIGIGDEIKSGCVNINGLLEVKVSTIFKNSTISKILSLVENAIQNKSQPEKFITKFARIYTPIVVILAVFVAFLPPLFMDNASFNVWIYKALIFLVVSCPCALVISVPLSFFGGIGGSSINGILIKGSNYLEALAKLDTLAFDKTGTLTKGEFQVDKIVTNNDMNEYELLKYAAYAEIYSTHPVGISLVKAYKDKINESLIKEIKELPGLGIKAIIEDKEILIGNEKLIKNANIGITQTLVHLSINSKYAGYITLKDTLKNNAKKTISWLKNSGIKTAILTGDKDSIAKDIANTLGIEQFYSELLPTDKVSKIENLIKNKKENSTIGFIGDGINDAPVLAQADVGIAVFGSDAAMEASDIVFMDNNLSKIISAIKISKKTMTIVKQNIIFAISIKVCFIILGFFGLANIWMAIFADMGVTFLVILNALKPYFYSINYKRIHSQN